MISNSYILVSAPADPTKQDTFNKLKSRVDKDLAEVYAFPLPDLKVPWHYNVD